MTTLIKTANLRRLLKSEGRRVSKGFISAFDASIVALARSYCAIYDGSRKTLMGDLLDTFPVKRGFRMPEKKRKPRKA